MSSIKTKEGYFTGAGDAELYYQAHLQKKPCGVLVVLHGLGEYSGRYTNLLDYFLPRGWSIYLYDQRGHGESPGPRVHTPSFSNLVEDLGLFLKKVRRETSDLPWFLIAHSFGAEVAVNYLANGPMPLQGVVLSAPNLKLTLEVPWLKKFMARRLSNVLPTLSLGNEIDAGFISHDPEVVERYRSDPQISHRMTLRMGSEILDNLENIMSLAPKIKVPSLLLHGSADRVTSCSGTEDFFSRMKAAHSKLIVYPDYYHELFNEIGKERVFADVEKWLKARLK